MKTSWKNLVYISLVIILLILGLRVYRIIKSLLRLHKVLPQFLENLYGSKIETDLTLTLHYTIIRLGITPELEQRKEDIRKSTREYINEFYPELKAERVRVEIVTLKVTQ
ncbi:MAG: hypothetical protein JXB60_01210 [Candidatus Cloacimonetes bacterium]|nr:hypothetical protein [Candidatus Cloacimonadota bacterium]